MKITTTKIIYLPITNYFCFIFPGQDFQIYLEESCREPWCLSVGSAKHWKSFEKTIVWISESFIRVAHFFSLIFFFLQIFPKAWRRFVQCNTSVINANVIIIAAVSLTGLIRQEVLWPVISSKKLTEVWQTAFSGSPRTEIRWLLVINIKRKSDKYTSTLNRKNSSETCSLKKKKKNAKSVRVRWIDGLSS